MKLIPTIFAWRSAVNLAELLPFILASKIICTYSVKHEILIEKSKNQPFRNKNKRQKGFRQKAEESAGSIKGSERFSTSFCLLPRSLLPFEPIMEKLILSYFL